MVSKAPYDGVCMHPPHLNACLLLARACSFQLCFCAKGLLFNVVCWQMFSAGSLGPSQRPDTQSHGRISTYFAEVTRHVHITLDGIQTTEMGER